MTPEEFSKKVLNHWPFIGAKSEADKESIAADLASFSNGRPPSVLEPIYEEFIATEPSKTFAIWWFHKRVTKNKSGKTWWRTCANGHLYEHKGSCCPVCGSYNFKLTTGKIMPMETVEIQESCCACKRYKQSMTDPIDGLDGPNCSNYGTEETGTLIECNQCQCRDCCQMAFYYVSNKVKYLHMVGPILKKKYEENGLVWATKKDGKMSKDGKMPV